MEYYRLMKLIGPYPAKNLTCRQSAGIHGRAFCFGLIMVGLCLLNTADAQTQIHKCTDAEGGVVYSQLPCVSLKSVEPEKTEPDPKTETASPVAATPELSITDIPQHGPKPGPGASTCKKHYRDAIDAIDAEISREYSPDKAEQYKQRLLLLTRKLRQCS